MKTATIAPIPHLDDLGVFNGDNYHLILSHLVHKSDEYARAYLNLSADGHFVILDNSAHETTLGQTAYILYDAWCKTCAREIVLPDRLFFGDDTVESSREAYNYLKPRVASDVKYMAVPQGRTFDEWSKCLDGLLTIEGVSTIGISKDYEPWPGGIPSLVNIIEKRCKTLSLPCCIHLLGWGRDALQLQGINSRYGDIIRGVDSAKPIMYAVAGIELPEIGDTAAWVNLKYPRRHPEFFDLKLDPETISLSEKNITRFRDFIH